MRVYSHSRLASYETCPMHYRLRYIEQVDVERRETIESFLGRRVHETLQYLYDRLSGGALLTLSELLAHLGNRWESEWHDRVQLVRTDVGLESYRGLADRCVRNYYRANHPFSRGRTVGTELAVVFVLDRPSDVHIKGYIDRLVRLAPGVYEIHDYKTSRRLPTQDRLDRDRQLGLYQMAVHQMMADADHVRLVWHYLAHGRRLGSLRSPEALDQLRRQTLILIERIEGAVQRDEFPAVRSRLCDWCDYRPVCPAWVPVQGRLLFPRPEPTTAATAIAEPPERQAPLAEMGVPDSSALTI